MDTTKLSTHAVFSQLDGRPINDTVVADDMFWQFVRASDILLNTNRSLIATAMPFLRFVPGEIRRCYLILLRVREQIYDRFLSKMKVGVLHVIYASSTASIQCIQCVCYVLFQQLPLHYHCQTGCVCMCVCIYVCVSLSIYIYVCVCV